MLIFKTNPEMQKMEKVTIKLRETSEALRIVLGTSENRFPDPQSVTNRLSAANPHIASIHNPYTSLVSSRGRGRGVPASPRRDSITSP